MKIIYVASEPRAGSTFLQLLLATHPQITGLGEIDQGIRRSKMVKCGDANLPPCSCGARQNDCPFWGPLLPQIVDMPELEAHRLIMSHFQQQFPNRVLVDSSKATAPLSRYYLDSPDAKNFDLRVIYVVRDFRGWVPSVHKHRANMRQWNTEEIASYHVPVVEKYRRDQKSFKFGYVQDSYRWMRRTKDALAFLQKSGVPHLVVSYEELVFGLVQQSARIGDFLGMNFDHDTNDLSCSQAHELYGSPILKTDKRKRERVFYDHSWLRDLRPALYAPLLKPVYKFNRSVYEELASSPPQNASGSLAPFDPRFVPRNK